MLATALLNLHGGRGTNLGIGAMRDMVNVTSAGVNMGNAVSTGGSMGNVLGSMDSVAGVHVSGVDTVVREDSGNVRGSASPGDGEGTSGAALSGSGEVSSVNTGTGLVNAEMVAAMLTAFLANQLPPLSKFDGGTSSSGNQKSVKNG